MPTTGVVDSAAGAAPADVDVGVRELVLQAGTVVSLATAERGRALLATADGYTAQLTPFDLAAKLQRQVPGSVEDYLAHASAAVCEWSPDELATMQRSVAVIREALAEHALVLPLPPVVEVVRTTMAEEGFMTGYTRRNLVVLGPRGLTPRTLAHELFHVATRHRPELRPALYGLLGFTLVPPVTPPSELRARIITNPDVPAIDTVIRLNLDGRLVYGAPLLVARRNYVDGPLGPYVSAPLLIVEPQSGSSRNADDQPPPASNPKLAMLSPRAEPAGQEVEWQPRLHHGQPELLDPEEVRGLAERLGGNTNYTLHPEEVSAEHFVFMLARHQHLPRPDLVAGMLELLLAASRETLSVGPSDLAPPTSEALPFVHLS